MRYAENEARRKRLQKQCIVTLAAELFLENGVENVSMVQIAEKGDVGVATLYRYFSTKTNLLLDVGAMLWEDLLRLFDGIFATDGYRDKPGIDQIGELLGFFLMLYREHSGFVRRYLRQNFLYVNISPVFLLVNGFCVSFFRAGRSFRHNKVVLRLLRAERHGAERPLAQGQIRGDHGHVGTHDLADRDAGIDFFLGLGVDVG